MSAHFGRKSGPAKLLRHGITLVGILKVVTVSHELHRSGFAPKMSRHSAVGSISVSPPQVDETEITGDRVEINEDSRVLFLLRQTFAPDPGDIHAARDRRERIKWRQTVPCSAHVLKQPSHAAAQPTHPTPPAVKHISGPSESYRMVRRSILDLICILDYDFEVPRASK